MPHEQTPPAETAAEAAERRLHGSSFGAAAAAYAEHRPGYADDAIRWCLGGATTGRVADIGAGTGILTAALIRLGADVTAIEPDPGMLAELRRRVPQARAVPGSAEAIPLPDGSLDAVLAAQALHWFDMGRALPEIARVLRPGGYLAALWNLDDDRAGWVARLAELTKDQGANTLLRYRATFARTPYGAALLAGGEQFEPAARREFPNAQRRTADSLVATIATHSRVLVMPPSQRQALLATARDYLRGRPETSAGEFDVPLVTVAVRTRRLPAPA